MRKIGLLGGTFDPIHEGHLELMKTAYTSLALDEVWILVNRIPPHKTRQSKTTDAQRLHMASLVADKYDYISVCDIELHREGKSYTFDTMTQLKTLYPEDAFYFMIGADNVEILPKWYRINELLDLVTFVAVKRSSYELKTDFPVLVIDMPPIDISSTMIRDGDFRHLDPDVLSYIEQEGLYGATDARK